MNIKYTATGNMIVDITYRALSTTQEVKNVFDAATEGSKLIPILRTIHPRTQRPISVFMVFNPAGGWAYGLHEYYWAEDNNLRDSGVNFALFEVPGMELMTIPGAYGEAEIPSDKLSNDDLVDDRTPEQRAADWKVLMNDTGLPMPEGKLIVA